MLGVFPPGLCRVLEKHLKYSVCLFRQGITMHTASDCPSDQELNIAHSEGLLDRIPRPQPVFSSLQLCLWELKTKCNC